MYCVLKKSMLDFRCQISNLDARSRNHFVSQRKREKTEETKEFEYFVSLPPPEKNRGAKKPINNLVTWSVIGIVLVSKIKTLPYLLCICVISLGSIFI